ncbi:hypothetical protein QC589_00630 [Halomonas elongata]|uniref:hypothetical protein n=1 Tax=Halomonas elongata TaxID=2746 RepID=UPI0033527C27
MSGKSATVADTTFASWAHRPMSGITDAEAAMDGAGVRHARMSHAESHSEAVATGDAYRITPAPDINLDDSLAVLDVSADRTAWMTTSTAEAPAALYCDAHITHIMGGQSVAEAASSIDYTTFWQASLRPLRTASLTWLAESRLDRLRVRQRFAEARTVVRARSRALPNSKIGRGSLRLESESRHVPGSLRLYRNHYGVASSSAASSAVPARIRHASSISTGVATTHIAPDLTLGNTTYCYASGRAFALSHQVAAGLCITEASGQAVSVSESAGRYFQIHAFTGIASASGDVPPVHLTSINPWVRATGKSEVVAEQSAYTLRERYIGLDALACESQQTAWCYRQVPTWDSMAGTASVVSDVHRLAKARAKEIAISTVIAQANVYGLRRPDIQPLSGAASGHASAHKTAWMGGGQEAATATGMGTAVRLAVPAFAPEPNEAALLASDPDITRYMRASTVAVAESSGENQPYRFTTTLSARARVQSAGVARKTARFVDDPAWAISSAGGGYDLNAFVRKVEPTLFVARAEGAGDARKTVRYIDEAAPASASSHAGYTRLAYLTPQPAINRSVATGTPHLTRRMRGTSISRADPTAYFARYRPASGQARASARVPVTIYVWRFFEMRFRGAADSGGEMLRITFIEPARVAESWAETGRVSYLINPDSPAPDRRTITLMPGARVMSVPASVREYQVA